MSYNLDSVAEKIKAENPKTVMSAAPDHLPGEYEETVLLICLRPRLKPSAVLSSIKRLIKKYKYQGYKTYVQYKGMFCGIEGHTVTIKYFDYTGKSKVDTDKILYYIAENTGI